MACLWGWPDPLTQLYCAASPAGLIALPLVKSWLADARLQTEASAPLLGLQSRETWVDCSRFVLMVFIVMGHYAAIPCSYVAEQSYWLGPLLAWINLFVMPGFAALSGYLSKGPLTKARLSRLLIFVLFPYILSKLVYWAWFTIEYRTVGWFDPFDAFSNSMGLEWYLIVLVQWRLAIVLMSPLSHHALLGSSLAIGLVSGNWVPGSASLALHRACSFFPFFVLGYTLDLAHLREVLTRRTEIRVAVQGVSVGILALLFCCPGIARLFMANTLGDLNFDYTGAIPTQATSLKVGPTGFMPVLVPLPRPNCGAEWVLSFVHRLVRYEIGALLLLSLLAWAPTNPALAQYGKYTMYPYLLHPWLFQLWLLPLMNRHLPTLLNSLAPFSDGGYVWTFTVILAPVLTLALSSSPVRFLTSVVIEPTWLGPLLLSSDCQLQLGPGKGKTLSGGPHRPLEKPQAPV